MMLILLSVRRRRERGGRKKRKWKRNRIIWEGKKRWKEGWRREKDEKRQYVQKFSF